MPLGFASGHARYLQGLCTPSLQYCAQHALHTNAEHANEIRSDIAEYAEHAVRNLDIPGKPATPSFLLHPSLLVGAVNFCGPRTGLAGESRKGRRCSLKPLSVESFELQDGDIDVDTTLIPGTQSSEVRHQHQFAWSIQLANYNYVTSMVLPMIRSPCQPPHQPRWLTLRSHSTRIVRFLRR